MRFMKFSEKILICFIATLLTLSLSLTVKVPLSSGEPDYTYYGVVPARIYSYNLTDSGNRTSGWRLDTGSIGEASLVVIVAAEDGTHVRVYDLTLGRLAAEFDLNSMEKQYALFANGTMFKVVSNKHVSVMLLNYHSIPEPTALELTLPFGFYTTTDGLYVGKEFVIMGSGQGISTDYIILALEKSSVTITKDDGSQLSISLDPNSFKYITLSPYRVYRITSTGNIMVQSGYIQGRGGDYVPCFIVPSAEGGFVGTHFTTLSLKSQEWGWDPERDYGFRITALEDTTVRVYDLETKMEVAKVTVKGGTGTKVQVESRAIVVQSDKPITLAMLHNGSITQKARSGTAQFASYGHGVLFIGIQPNVDTPIHLPTSAQIDAYFFAVEETTLVIDEDIYTIDADSPLPYITPGTHIVRANKNVVLQVNFWPLEPEYQGLEYTGAIIPCVETVNKNPEVTFTPIEGGFPIMYIVAGAAVAAVAAVVGLFAVKRRGGKPS
ncbi:MAG: hypothetical protein QXZ70_00125 [Candidatus Bathyarchaeia archaeon]